MKGRLLGEEIGGGGTKGGGGEKGGDPGQGCPVTGPHRSKLLAKLHMEQQTPKQGTKFVIQEAIFRSQKIT